MTCAARPFTIRGYVQALLNVPGSNAWLASIKLKAISEMMMLEFCICHSWVVASVTVHLKRQNFLEVFINWRPFRLQFEAF